MKNALSLETPTHIITEIIHTSSHFVKFRLSGNFPQNLI